MNNLILFFFTLKDTFLDQGSTTINLDTSPPSEPKETASIILPICKLEFTLSVSVLIFGLIIIFIENSLIKKLKIDSEDTIKIIVITLIIVGTLFLITAGYSNNQIAPAMGLLGTIAGYLLGKIKNS